MKDARSKVSLSVCSASFLCTICKKYCSSKCNLKIHMLKHKDERPYICNQLVEAFETKQTLNNQPVVHISERYLPFSCTVCQKRCKTRQSLQAHMGRHDGEKPFACGHCGKQFSQKHHMQHHEKTVHMLHLRASKKPGKVFFGSKCHQKCDDETKLFSHENGPGNEHIQLHLSDRPRLFLCAMCPKSYFTKKHLAEHMRRIHNSKNPFARS